MEVCGRHFLKLLALCFYAQISSCGQDRGNSSYLNYVFSQETNFTSSVLNNTTTPRMDTLKNSETEAYDVTTSGIHEAEVATRIESLRTTGSTQNSDETVQIPVSEPVLLDSNDSITPRGPNLPFIDTASPSDEFDDFFNQSSSLEAVSDVTTTQSGNSFDGNETTESPVQSTKSAVEPSKSTVQPTKSTDLTRNSDFLYHVMVGENCTKETFRSDMESPVTECSLPALLQSHPGAENLSLFESLSLTTKDMNSCRLVEGELEPRFVLNGSITLSSDDDLFLERQTSQTHPLCVRLRSPPMTVFQIQMKHFEDWMEIRRYNKGAVLSRENTKYEYYTELYKGRDLVSDGNDVELAVHGLQDFENSTILKTLKLTFQAVPWCKKEQLEVECASDNKTGYIQTPHWDGQHICASHMNSCVTVTTPAAHFIMISFVELDLNMCEGCICDVLEIYFTPACTGSPVLRLCGSTEPFPFIQQADAFSVRFKSNYQTEKTGFRLLFSIHSPAVAPKQLWNGRWFCSGARGPLLVQHFICSSRTFCVSGEDEISDGCPSRELCGVRSVDFDGKCYRHVKPDRKITWSDAASTCKSNKGGLVSLNTEAEWREVVDFWLNTTNTEYLMVGLKQSRGYGMPHLYSSMWVWSDKSVAYYLNISHASMISPPYCAVLKKQEQHLTIISCDSPLKAHYLCEQNSQASQRFEIELPSSSRADSVFPYVSECPNKELTYAFWRCDRQSRCYGDEGGQIKRCLGEDPVLAKTMFTCRNKKLVHYTLVCDFHPDCEDNSDEDFCVFSDCPSDHFVCLTSDECLQPTSHCDGKLDCEDESDETTCLDFIKAYESNTVLPPAVIDFTGTGDVTITALNVSHRGHVCPETHFQCPGDGYCLPVYVRCNGVSDCPKGEDEESCVSYACPGFYRCQGSTICVHVDHLCDGLVQCPRRDDELMCYIDSCPPDCQCIGFAFICPNKFSAEFYPRIRYLNADGTGMNLEDVANNTLLIFLSLRYCSIKEIGIINLPNVQTLDLSYNALQRLSWVELKEMKNLRSLSLAFNKLLSLNSIPHVSITLQGLIVLDMSGGSTREITNTSFSSVPNLQYLNLSGSTLQKVKEPGFSTLHMLKILDISECLLDEFYGGMFRGLSYLDTVYASKFHICCPSVLPQYFIPGNCHAPSDEVSSCAALLRADVFRVFLVVYVLFGLIGNFVSFVCRVFSKRMTSNLGFDIFVTHLCVSDFLMGIYLAIIGIADRIYYGTYEWDEKHWKQSVACKSAGFLSLLSSEVSSFLICFITLERFLLVRFPHRNLRFTPKLARAACVCGWVVGVLLAAIPLLPFSPPWDFYSQTGICIPLPITRKVFPGSGYSFFVMIVFNFVLFILIAIGQLLIFWSVRSQTKLTGGSKKRAKDMAIARRLLAVVMTNFLCWFPIGLLGLMAKSGIPISGGVNVAMAIFVLPFNSALNPFLYTFHTMLERYRAARAQRQRNTESEMTCRNCPSCAAREQVLSQNIAFTTTAERPVNTENSVTVLIDEFLEDNLLTVEHLHVYVTKMTRHGNSTTAADVSIDH